MKPISKVQLIITVLVIAGIIALFANRKIAAPVPTDNTPSAIVEWPSVETDKKTISEENQYYAINASYPVTKDDRITAHLKAFVEDQIAQFKEDTAWVMDESIDSSASGVLSLEVDYREQRSTHADNYIFQITSYTGGAHGLQATRTFAFDKIGKSIVLTDLFTNGEAGIKTVATFVQTELTKKKISDADWIKDGAGATADNYQNFVIEDTGVTFIFDPYQVAAYAAGTQNILVPVSVFKSIANPEVFGK